MCIYVDIKFKIFLSHISLHSSMDVVYSYLLPLAPNIMLICLRGRR
ncbi:hypothetical protein LOK49_LG07G00222 [Camellia lanceoleosa]|uniref:Uncharacterized protein n=1 Tax=Camellia lanceoleosa TaxID=1840588 RepID=A0ACC0H5I2_9ERIC|nr:hypothetical protein LOK49_LG07G00222 [Camellia lanceoleosa]